MGKPFELKGRRVEMFRCHLDPAIGPKARNAFSKHEYPGWEFELTPIGVYVKTEHKVPGQPTTIGEHLVPYANIQSIKLFAKTKEEE
jgi:hypothetical protein